MNYWQADKARKEAMRKARNAAFYVGLSREMESYQCHFRESLQRFVRDARAFNRICVARRKEWRTQQSMIV